MVLLKLVAAWLPLAVSAGWPGRGREPSLRPGRGRQPERTRRRAAILRRLTIVEATILTLYGLVLSITGWLVQARVIADGPGADTRALAWHAFLWDPWFLAWGLLVCATLRCSPPPDRAS